MNRANDTRDTLERHLPLLLGLLAALLAGRALRRLCWSALVLAMALHYSGLHPFG